MENLKLSFSTSRSLLNILDNIHFEQMVHRIYLADFR